MKKNIIALLKGIVCPVDASVDNRITVSTVQAHLMQLGYMLTEDAFEVMGKADLAWIEDFHNEVVPYLKENLGGKHNYKALYKNFPAEVMSASDYELFMNAVRHYWSNGTWEPSTETFEKPIKLEKIKYTMLEFGNEARFNRIFTDLVSINQSLAPNDLAIIKAFVENGYDLVFPRTIPFKENLCTLAGMGLQGLPIKTTTDVLRIAVHMSGGDISLPAVPAKMVKARGWYGVSPSENTERDAFKFKKFTRAERKLILGFLEKSNCDTSEMVLKDQRWIRLGEILHPGEYKDKFPRAYEAFRQIRNEKVESWYGKLEKAKNLSLDAYLIVLSQRPGEFMRKLDELVRNNTKKLDSILTKFKEVGINASNKVLFEAYGHFEDRRIDQPTRSIMIKGTRKATVLPALPKLDKNVVDVIQSTIFEALSMKFAELPALGNVWIDEELKKIPLPTNMRSLNLSMKPQIRGQRIPLDNPEAKVVRAYYHWFDKNGTLDPDLSATFVGKGRRQTLSFSGLKVGKSVHSGDIIARQGACAEYVDIDVQDALKMGFRYVAIDVRSYRGGPLKEMDGYFGTMCREHPQANKTWNPETVANAQQTGSTAQNTMLGVIDLETMEYIFLDLDMNGPNYAAGDSNIEKLIEMYCRDPKVSVYDLVVMHVNGRGVQASLDMHVDTYFRAEDFMSSYEETGKLMGI